MTVDRVYREQWARLLGMLAGSLRRLDLAEDCLQEAFVIAVTHWAENGVPDNPAAWLRTTAHRRALDRLRSEATLARKLPLLLVREPDPSAPQYTVLIEAAMTDSSITDAAITDAASPIPDDRLQLIFTCCHPALSPDARAALTLRFVGGLSTAAIARLFLVPEPTMGARLTRAKKKIVLAGIPFAVPDRGRLAERLDVVLTVLYLMFTQGYAVPTTTPRGQESLVPVLPDQLVPDQVVVDQVVVDQVVVDEAAADLAAEAIRLGRVLNDSLPGDPKVEAMLALMLAQHARRDARFDPIGDLVLLPEQDRTRWHWDEIRSARTLLGEQQGTLGTEPYRLQAHIAVAHAVPDPADTDWAEIARLYAQLEEVTGSPVVRLNRAVAVARLDGPAAAWKLLQGLESQLPSDHYLPAVRGELLFQLGAFDPAVGAFEVALGLVGTASDRRHLAARREAALREATL